MDNAVHGILQAMILERVAFPSARDLPNPGIEPIAGRFFTSWATREAQAGFKIAGRNINNLRYADDTTLMAESKEKLKDLLMEVKKESEKVGSKLNIQKLRSWHLVPSFHGK